LSGREDIFDWACNGPLMSCATASSGPAGVRNL